MKIRGRPFKTKHGHAGWKHKSKTYMAWQEMHNRCRHHHFYVGKGICVCDEWKRFNVFLSEMGERPAGCGIDRIDNSLGYSKANCRWVTKVQQMNNQTKNIFLTAFGERKTVAMWARDSRCMTGYAGLRKRILRGVSPEVAITTPNRKPCGVMEEA